jgi:hypothetical protein
MSESPYPRPYVAREGDRALTFIESRLSSYFASRDFEEMRAKVFLAVYRAKSLPTHSDRDLKFLR